MTNKLSAITIRRLRKIQAQIEAEPRQFRMWNWFEDNDELHSKSAIPNCGTAACIAGWSVSMSSRKKPAVARYNSVSYASVAMDYLRLDEYAANLLFYEDRWPRKFMPKDGDRFDSFSPAKRAKMAIARINHFIKTNGQE